MSIEPMQEVSSWLDRLGQVPDWAAFVAVIAVIFIGIHATAHVLLAPAGHLQVSMQGILVGLWSLTTLIAFGGLAALGGSYISDIRYPDSEPQLDLDILPEDERRLLDPIITTPGITQVEVVDRSGYSDAKVSQTLKALRERGLVYRESQGRTYRLYPGTILSAPPSEP